MAWRNDLPGAVGSQSLRVGGAGCAPGCGPDDLYRIRLYDTTYTISRFNNSATQSTVVFIQNPSDQTVAARAHFWSASGTLLRSLALTIAPRALPTASCAASRCRWSRRRASHSTTCCARGRAEPSSIALIWAAAGC